MEGVNAGFVGDDGKEVIRKVVIRVPQITTDFSLPKFSVPKIREASTVDCDDSTENKKPQIAAALAGRVLSVKYFEASRQCNSLLCLFHVSGFRCFSFGYYIWLVLACPTAVTAKLTS